MTHAHQRAEMPDHAALTDDRQLPIDQVGIRGLSYPILVWDRSERRQATVAQLALSVGLPSHFKGTHMSRFVEILHEHRGELSLGTAPELLAEIQRRLDARDAFIDASFPYFMTRKAPVSGAESLMEYRSRFVAARRDDALDFMLEVQVPVKTLCPCSKAISQYGAHNQRSVVTVQARFEGMLWIEDIVEDVEGCASSPLYALLKREDEKWVTERAYERPRFVEDLVREVVLALRARPNVRWLRVSAENFESIHNHSAWAELQWPAAAPEPAGPVSRPAPTPFGAWVRQRRVELHQSQRELAEKLQVSASILSRVEQGETAPTAALARQLAEAWGMEPEKVMLRAGHVPPELMARISGDPEGFLAWAGG